MSGTIRTYQKCPGCGGRFPSSKGGFPIICERCKTQPTKYFINVWWDGRPEFVYYDSDGRTMHDWGHAVALLGEIRSRMVSHKNGKGYFNPDTYKRSSSTSFNKFWERFLAGYKGPTRDKISTIGRHHLTYFSDIQMRDIRAYHIDDWWRELQDKGLSPRYCNDIQTWLRSFFKNALDLDIIEKYPRFPRMLKVEKKEIEYLTEEQQLAVLDAIPKYDKPIFDFLFLTGVRVNEAIALQYSCIGRKKGIVTILHTIKRDGTLGPVKNRRPRRIPLGAVRGCFKQSVIGIPKLFVFQNKWGRRYSDDYLRGTFYKACDSAGVPRIKLKNATRHSFGMNLLAKGYDIWQTSKIMGHSDIKITENYATMMDKEMVGAYGRSETVVKQKINEHK